MVRTQLSPPLCVTTQTSRLRPWSWLLYIDKPDSPASLAGCFVGWVGDDAGGLGLGYMDRTVEALWLKLAPVGWTQHEQPPSRCWRSSWPCALPPADLWWPLAAWRSSLQGGLPIRAYPKVPLEQTNVFTGLFHSPSPVLPAHCSP